MAGGEGGEVGFAEGGEEGEAVELFVEEHFGAVATEEGFE